MFILRFSKHSFAKCGKTGVIEIKNFERIEGNLNIPDGFEPLRVSVDLKQHDGERLSVNRVFEWYAGET